MRLRPFRLERFFARHEFEAPYVLCGSDCEPWTVGELLALETGSEERLRALGLGYTESPGSPALRREIAGLYRAIAPDQVLVHTGAEEAIFNFMNAVLEPGDHVVVHAPGYQSLTEVPRSIGCAVTRWRAAEADDWEPDVDWLRRRLRRNTRLIVVNTPHNPTGSLLRRETFDAVLALAAERGILVLSDEVYRFLEHSGAERLPAACDVYDNAVSLGVLSKTFGLPGLRVGWVATRNRRVYRAMAAFKDYTTICNPAPSELLATVALRHRETLSQRSLEIVSGNVRRVGALFERHPELFSWVPPRAGSTAFPRYLGAEGSGRFCADLLAEAGVLLLPSRHFGFGDRHFRIGLGRRALAEGLERLEERLEWRRAAR